MDQPRVIPSSPYAQPSLRSIRRFVRRLRPAGLGLCVGAVALVSAVRPASADPTAGTLPPVNITPSAGGLPGTSTLLNMLGGLQFDAMLAAIAGVIIGAGVWAVSAHSNNYQGSGRGRTAVLASALAALVIGFGPSLVHTLFNTGAAAQ